MPSPQSLLQCARRGILSSISESRQIGPVALTNHCRGPAPTEHGAAAADRAVVSSACRPRRSPKKASATGPVGCAGRYWSAGPSLLVRSTRRRTLRATSREAVRSLICTTGDVADSRIRPTSLSLFQQRATPTRRLEPAITERGAELGGYTRVREYHVGSFEVKAAVAESSLADERKRNLNG